MKNQLSGAALLALVFSFQAAAASPVPSAEAHCARCEAILGEIREQLSQRCASAPSVDALRRQPIYLFLSIYDQISSGINPQMRRQVYRAALEGMACDDINAGVEAAKRTASRLQG